ncbi:uncharacterized protein [Canis lupus baileyi]|uniref:uncharacterized protein n=1 Tax=Canis lupus baileyi TaxID=143281 RepID=UPI003B97331B
MKTGERERERERERRESEREREREREGEGEGEGEAEPAGLEGFRAGGPRGRGGEGRARGRGCGVGGASPGSGGGGLSKVRAHSPRCLSPAPSRLACPRTQTPEPAGQLRLPQQLGDGGTPSSHPRRGVPGLPGPAPPSSVPRISVRLSGSSCLLVSITRGLLGAYRLPYRLRQRRVSTPALPSPWSLRPEPGPVSRRHARFVCTSQTLCQGAAAICPLLRRISGLGTPQLKQMHAPRLPRPPPAARTLNSSLLLPCRWLRTAYSAVCRTLGWDSDFSRLLAPWFVAHPSLSPSLSLTHALSLSLSTSLSQPVRSCSPWAIDKTFL